MVEPEGAAALAGHSVTQPDHPIQGGGYATPDLSALRGVAIDGYWQISGSRARDAARMLARSEGIFAGYSAGANVAAALDVLATHDAGGTIGVIICDSGLKYLSTDLWDGPPEGEVWPKAR